MGVGSVFLGNADRKRFLILDLLALTDVDDLSS